MKAYILNIVGWMLLPFMDGIAKLLSTDIHFMQVVWGRYFFMFFYYINYLFNFFRKYLKWPLNINIQLIRGFFSL